MDDNSDADRSSFVPHRRRGGRLRALLVVPVVVAASLAASVFVEPDWWSREAPVPVAAPQPSTDPTQREAPLPGLEAAPSPRGRPIPAPLGGGPHQFLTLQADGLTPVAYDPCRPIHYVLRSMAAPVEGEVGVHEAIVHEAVAAISQLTGLRFLFDGPTDEAVVPGRASFQPDRYGDRWAPVLIDWQPEADNPGLAGDRVGEAGSTAASLGDGPRVYVSGTVTLDATQLPTILAEKDGRATVRAIVLHELGHLLGLGHVDDGTQLMYPETRIGVTDFAAGDLTGLAVLGAGPCVPDL